MLQAACSSGAPSIMDPALGTLHKLVAHAFLQGESSSSGRGDDGTIVTQVRGAVEGSIVVRRGPGAPSVCMCVPWAQDCHSRCAPLLSSGRALQAYCAAPLPAWIASPPQQTPCTLLPRRSPPGGDHGGKDGGVHHASRPAWHGPRAAHGRDGRALCAAWRLPHAGCAGGVQLGHRLLRPRHPGHRQVGPPPDAQHRAEAGGPPSHGGL